VGESQIKFKIPREGERSPLELVTGGVMKTQQTAIVNCGLYRLMNSYGYM
jgi:hypothetical protein